ncbi:hypothetical protein [uncultured Shewanella sp.]|uniref:hypothetical protein n=1 Tax=Shewanella atlantica TaxID=271099 RepID=UPI0026235483|nr:hypothetical protein [uncultured Shewanella sp.]
MTELKIRTVGSGLGVELPQELLDQLKLNKGESLLLEPMANGNYRLARIDALDTELMTLIESYMHEEDA